ncbi:zinc finger protein 2-like isoform X1 [Homalodisca vitripennis]|nr:zinc finger protein 2-like isoform X1 [Homalodisca vitripennis]XP_046664702.1 zinc finger protein 2-like isoform X1 [Homalodisca vitripennis]KAG8311428.1 hypothetical protein J6590_043346 [Homalodisca vitripennis]
MENKVSTSPELPIVSEGFINIPNHSNCAKFEGNLSPPSAHGKVLANLDHPKQSLHPELPPWLLHPTFLNHPYHNTVDVPSYCNSRLKQVGDTNEPTSLEQLRSVSQDHSEAPVSPLSRAWPEPQINIEVEDTPKEKDVTARFHCQTCGKGFPSASSLLGHEHHHTNQQRPHHCETCFKTFATNSHLVTHKRTHTGERPYRCQVCHRSFSDRSAFVKHERTHGPDGTIVKRYKCDMCGNHFTDNCGLKKHIRIHTGERPYQCDICEKAFSTSSTFVAHRRIHTGERPYKCEQCSKMFITKSHLLTHGRVHSGEKPFVCPICSRSFADGSSFRRHERLHTGEQRHNCQVCGKGFPVSASLQKHMQQSHSYS